MVFNILVIFVTNDPIAKLNVTKSFVKFEGNGGKFSHIELNITADGEEKGDADFSYITARYIFLR